jgi:hypothetical protein
MTSLDEILPNRALNGFTYPGGNANHIPMAADALEAMNRADGIAAMVAANADGQNLAPLPGGSELDDDWTGERGAALGKFDRIGDWLATARNDLRMDDWPDVVARWVDVLATGSIGALFHGLLRTAHACRSLARTRSNIRADEIARGLAYWAAMHWAPHDGSATRVAPADSAAVALSRVPRVDPSNPSTPPAGDRRITPALAMPGFYALIGLVDCSDPMRALGEVTRVMSRVLAANAPRGIGPAIIFVHTVTAPAAAQLLVPHLPHATAVKLAEQVWFACAALCSGQAERYDDAPSPVSDSWDALIDRAVASANTHAIKVTEATSRVARELPEGDGDFRAGAAAYLAALSTGTTPAGS